METFKILNFYLFKYNLLKGYYKYLYRKNPNNTKWKIHSFQIEKTRRRKGIII